MHCLIRIALVVMVLITIEGFDFAPKSFKEYAVGQKLNGLRKIAPLIATAVASTTVANKVLADPEAKFEYQPMLQGLDYGKSRTYYPDFIQKPSGLQYKVVTEGSGKTPKQGDRVVVDWEGYTIGYYGRPFQSRNKVKGGAFESTEKDFFRWVVGSGNAVAALDECVKYLREGSVAQVIVPAELGYPVSGDPEHDLVGPKPSTFSGLRALNFVLENKNMIDKTLLINVKVVRVDTDYNASKQKST